jgi:formylglycine-generating enzyme required for sulfatase activity
MIQFRFANSFTILLIVSVLNLPSIKAQAPKNVIENGIGMKLILIPKGTFTMGGNNLPGDRIPRDPHQVTLTKDYYLGIYEVTQEQYQQLMQENPSHFAFPGLPAKERRIAAADRQRPNRNKNSNHPVENVSWNPAMDFCNRLSELPEEQAAGRKYQLPTEAEWEYACRAGSKDIFCFGDNMEGLDSYAWFRTNSGNRKLPPDLEYEDSLEDKFQLQTHRVGTKRPNNWGLYDMHGNVEEWCIDSPKSYDGNVVDPFGSAHEENNNRVIRGGCWSSNKEACTSARRWDGNPKLADRTIGFRVAMQVEMRNQTETNSSRNAVLQKNQPGLTNRKAGNVINAKVTPTNPFLLPNGAMSLRFRKVILDSQARFRDWKPLPHYDSLSSNGPEEGATLEIAHKDFSLIIIPRTVIYLEGNCIEFTERSTLKGENRSDTDMVAYVINEASIPVSITKKPAPKVTLQAFDETLEIPPFETEADIHTIRGKGIHFLSILITELDFKNYDHATKTWEGDVEVQLINNAGSKRIAVKDKKRLEVVLGNEVIAVECLNYEFSKGTVMFHIQTKPKQNTITATIGEYASGKP